MALVSHTIVSRYTPQQRDPITEPDLAEDDPWQTESSFGAAQRLHSRPAPYFVAASLDYDEYGMPKAPAGSQPKQTSTHDAVDDVGAWYRSLTSRGKARQYLEPSSSSSRPPTTTAGPSSHPLTSEEAEPSSSAATPISHKPNWFTSRPLPSDSIQPSKPSTLADLLSRNPPPLPSEPAFKPPVFLALGPGNRGYTMLQRKGWQEGEGLGSARVERRAREGLGMKRRLEETFQWDIDAQEHKHKPRRQLDRTTTSLIDDARQEIIDLTLSDSEELGKHEVVDLTLSDSESESEPEPKLEEPDETLPSASPPPSPHGTTLLTPIATTLKADRLGIGLKRRTAKSKAVTHTSAALAAHIRSANHARKDKAKHGRGSRGFARRKREEERERVGLLAYMNS